jgi:hypothetical protein
VFSVYSAHFSGFATIKKIKLGLNRFDKLTTNWVRFGFDPLILAQNWVRLASNWLRFWVKSPFFDEKW